MKKYILILTVGLLLIAGTNYAYAQQKGQFELGGIINSPTGVSAKGWINEQVAIDGALSFSLSDNFSSVYLHSDILFHSNSLNGKLGLTGSNADAYYGAGLRFSGGDLDEHLGLRFPGGITYGIDDTPLITFFEIAPVLDVSPDVGLRFAGAVGARFNLN